MGNGDIFTLTDGMTGLRGKPLEVHLSQLPGFLRQIAALNTQLDNEVANARNLQGAVTSAAVGDFTSAGQTQENLGKDVGQFIDAVHNFQRYLTAFHDTVEAVGTNIGKVSNGG